MFWCWLSHSFLSQLIEELEVLVSDPQEGRKHQEELMNLQELVHHKHLLITEEILKVAPLAPGRCLVWLHGAFSGGGSLYVPPHFWQRASVNTDTETGNMQTVVKDDNITLCLWANLKKNPRLVRKVTTQTNCIIAIDCKTNKRHQIC